MVITFLASFLIWLLFFGLFILWVIDGKIKKEQVIHALFACFVTVVLTNLIKYFFPTVRPFLEHGGEIKTLTVPFGNSFPSEHTALAFALSVTIFMHDRRIGWFYLAAAILVGTARVVANVHYPVDIMGGAFIGTLVAVVVEQIHFMSLARKITSKFRHS